MKIEEFLKKNSISMRAFAKMIGVAHNTIWHIKIGKIPFPETANLVIKGSNGQVGYEDMGYININNTWIRPYGKVSD